MLSKLHKHEHPMTCPVLQIFICVNYHQIYCELDAAAYIIGISVKSWVRQSLCRVDGGCMGLRMLWFAFGFVLSDALFQEFFSVLTANIEAIKRSTTTTRPRCIPNISNRKLLVFQHKASAYYWPILA